MKRRSPELPARESAGPATEGKHGSDVTYSFVEPDKGQDHSEGSRGPTRRQPIRLLRLPQVIQLVGLRRASIYKMQSEGRFPRRVKLGIRAVGWVEEEIQEWLAKRIEENDAPAPARAHDVLSRRSGDK